jgi:hypothetical protein
MCDIQMERVLSHCGDPDCPELEDHCLWITIDTTVLAAVKLIGYKRTKDMFMKALLSPEARKLEAERTEREARDSRGS